MYEENFIEENDEIKNKKKIPKYFILLLRIMVLELIMKK